jgi:hypothetical protein
MDSFSVKQYSLDILYLKGHIFLNKLFFGVPHLATCIFLILSNLPEFCAEIDPGMALIPLPSSIGWRSNLQPSNHVPKALPLDHKFRLNT